MIRRNERNANKHSAESKALADEIKDYAAAAHTRSRVTQSYRKDNIVIKVEHVIHEDKVEHKILIAALDALCAAHGIEVVQLGKHKMFYIK